MPIASDPLMKATNEQHPRLAVSAVIRQGNQLLLIERAKAPGAGLLAFPGGKVHWGETVRQALIREVHEETGLQVEPTELLGCSDLIVPGDNTDVIEQHFVILSWFCHWTGGTARAGSDAARIAWLDKNSIQACRNMPDNVRRLALQVLNQETVG